ncbi:hypothetical protein A2165_01695 [Candidatus Curtissbacteria bacterium RBG_13_40_7]|uniref:FCP1 homology domain-containing protein n=1 Tax=Candidatus Curtissbacteria bacterium RBG_13_40_7 TaxID=1797706 RepID=A0A1F5FWN6_9BACT|nr:MAG: hypothetical protein A2165_01695 [Candidatus Curtissbacteria bacterium RBG_13_40_7]
MNIYLDIDGVILANDVQPALHAKEFLEYVVNNHDVYWLTTHCKGDAEYTVNFISRFFDADTIESLKKIKPTNWNTLKTEAINFDTPFLWFDDQLFDSEIDELDCRNVRDQWIKVDLSKNVHQLKDLVENFPKVN